MHLQALWRLKLVCHRLHTAGKPKFRKVCCLVCCTQIAANNAPSVFGVNADGEEPKQEIKPEPKQEPPEIVSKWTLVDYDAEEQPAAGCASPLPAIQ